MSQDYKATLHLPATEFPMRGDLPKREPGILSRWEDEGLYARLRENAQGRPLFAEAAHQTFVQASNLGLGDQFIASVPGTAGIHEGRDSGLPSPRRVGSPGRVARVPDQVTSAGVGRGAA